jgi:hypothetical protein
MNFRPKLDTDEAREFWEGVARGARRYEALPEDQRGVLSVRRPAEAAPSETSSLTASAAEAATVRTGGTSSQSGSGGG